MKNLAVVLISVVTALTGVTPAEAFPAVNLDKPKIVSGIEQVKDRGWNKHGGNRGRNYSNRYKNRGGYHGRHNNNDNDVGAIIGGLALGAIIGGALAQPYYGREYYAPEYYAQPGYYGGGAHTRWCYSRYRSYRAWDNTFQPYYGPRQQCYGPY